MIKNKSRPKKELSYNKIDRVARWNYCQLIGKYILESSVSDEELKSILLDIQGGDYKLVLNVLIK